MVSENVVVTGMQVPVTTPNVDTAARHTELLVPVINRAVNSDIEWSIY